MPTPESLLAFIIAAAILTLTPGVDTALVLRAAAIGGARRGLEAAFGIVLGCLAWGAAISMGLGVMLTASPIAFSVLKWAGAIYLAGLGISLVVRPRAALTQDDRLPADRGSRQSLQQGFVTNLLNPKVGLFYLTFLPQFISGGADGGAGFLFLAVVHALLSLVWLAVIAFATMPLRRLIERPVVIRRLDRISGLSLLLLLPNWQGCRRRPERAREVPHLPESPP